MLLSDDCTIVRETKGTGDDELSLLPTAETIEVALVLVVLVVEVISVVEEVALVLAAAVAATANVAVVVILVVATVFEVELEAGEDCCWLRAICLVVGCGD